MRQGPRCKAAVAVATLAAAVLAVASPVRAAAVLAVAKLVRRTAASTSIPAPPTT